MCRYNIMLRNWFILMKIQKKHWALTAKVYNKCISRSTNLKSHLIRINSMKRSLTFKKTESLILDEMLTKVSWYCVEWHVSQVWLYGVLYYGLCIGSNVSYNAPYRVTCRSIPHTEVNRQMDIFALRLSSFTNSQIQMNQKKTQQKTLRSL